MQPQILRKRATDPIHISLQTIHRNSKIILAAAAALMCIAVILGAMGAHALQSVLSVDQMESFETGVRYQAWHCIAILALQCIPESMVDKKAVNRACAIMLGGTVLFSFSIYLLNTRYLMGMENIASVLGPVTPIGGLLLIAGWVYITLSFISGPKTIR